MQEVIIIEKMIENYFDLTLCMALKLLKRNSKTKGTKFFRVTNIAKWILDNYFTCALVTLEKINRKTCDSIMHKSLGWVWVSNSRCEELTNLWGNNLTLCWLSSHMVQVWFPLKAEWITYTYKWHRLQHEEWDPNHSASKENSKLHHAYINQM